MVVCRIEFRIAKQYRYRVKDQECMEFPWGPVQCRFVEEKYFLWKLTSEGERRGSARRWFSGQRGKRNDSRKGAPPQANSPIRTRRTFCLPFHLHRRHDHHHYYYHNDSDIVSAATFRTHFDVYFSPLKSCEGGFPSFSSPLFVPCLLVLVGIVGVEKGL